MPAENGNSTEPGDFVLIVTPLGLATISDIEMVELFRDHAPRITETMNYSVLIATTDEHKEMFTSVVRERALKAGWRSEKIANSATPGDLLGINFQL